MSTISNDRIQQIMTRCVPFHGECAAPVSVIEVKAMATELLALRKERERAEPVAWRNDEGPFAVTRFKSVAETWMTKGWKVTPLYTAPPAPTDKPKSEMSQQAEQLLRDTTALAVTLSGETDTTSQQFESLAGKAVGRSDGFECTPVADLYELLTKCGECYDYTTSAKVAAAWIKDGYSAREYVKLDRLQEAMTQGSAGEGDGWIPCSERMPVEKDIVLVVDDGYFVCEAQYREGDFFSAVRGNNEFFETTCRDVEFWQPLPEPPCK
ncbi:DUF551 domain-containing protein [Cronobacter malonaticus]